MVRTKDLLLIVVVLIMLGMAISATVASRMLEAKQDQSVVIGSGSEAPVYEASSPLPETDKRQETIARLKEKISQGDVIDASPSVEAPESESVTSAVTVSCGVGDNGLSVARSWPLESVEVIPVGLTREVSQIIYAPAIPPTGTGTPSAPVVLSKNILIQLPLVPQKSAQPQCLDSEVIGVTVNGSLMFNADAVLYRNTIPGTLLGYARDGFPIYGAYAGERDQCGGYDSPAGYRYSLAPDGSTFINCFTGVPQSFNQ